MWPWCYLAASQRRPYCASVNSHSPVGVVSQQWDTIDSASVLCDRCIHSDQASRSASSRRCTCPFYSVYEGFFFGKALHHPAITMMRLPVLQCSWRLFFWQSITSPRSVSPPTAQIWLPATSSFTQNYNRHWKGGDLWMWRSHSTQAESTASHCRLTSPTGEWLFTDAQ